MCVEEDLFPASLLHFAHLGGARVVFECRGELVFERSFESVNPDPARVRGNWDTGRVVTPCLDVLRQRFETAEAAPDAGACEFGGETGFVALDGGAEAVGGWEGDAALGEEEVVDQEEGEEWC